MERVLGVALGIAIVCLLLSIIASHLQEVWASFTARRASVLEAGIRSMLGNDDLAKKFFEHPLIETISFSVPRTLTKQSPTKQARPIYVASALFSRVLFATLADYHNAPGKTSLPELIQKLPPSPLQRRLQAIVVGTGNDSQACALAIEQWYDGTMDRINGFYKQKTQWTLLTLGFILAIISNANLFSITQKLWTSDDARVAVTAAAQMYPCRAGANCAAGDYVQARNEISRGLEQYIPVGYHGNGLRAYWGGVLRNIGERWHEWKTSDPRWHSWPPVLSEWFFHLAGWGLTGLAVSLGAPFWFDAVNKLINLRLNGPQPPRATPPGIGSTPPPPFDGGGVQVLAPQLNAPVVNVNLPDPAMPADTPGLHPPDPDPPPQT